MELNRCGSRLTSSKWSSRMPTDLSVALERRAAINAELKLQEGIGVLFIPVVICIVTVIMAIQSPTSAAAVCAMSAY
jgi:hypothetical protein